MNKFMKKRRSQFGGAAMEYVVVSTFALLVAVAGIGFVGKLFQEKMQAISEKLGVDAGDFDLPHLLE